MIPTPALVVDLAAVDANLEAAARLAGGVPIRPHFKAHKCVPLLLRQLASPGHRGVTCATAEEALVLAEQDVTDVLIANEVVDPAALADLATAARRLGPAAAAAGTVDDGVPGVTVAIDSQIGLDRLVAALETAGASAGVLVDLDVGQGRGGLAPGDPAVVELARAAATHPRLAFRGLMGYDGHAQHLDAAGRRTSTARVAELLQAERERLEAAGLLVEVLSGGGSGTLADAAAAGALTEVQAGSYVLLDVEYGDLDLGFAPAVHCETTVVTRRGDTAVLDAGLKALSAEHGLPHVLRDDAETVGIADEHLTLRLRPGSPLAVGDRVAVRPHHLDPTVSLHDALFVSSGEEVRPWPVAGRPSAMGRYNRALRAA